MAKEMLINVSEGEECRIALLDGGKLEELYMERTSSTSHVGNIYKGRVTNVEPSIQAAFVDFGLGRNGFLHISDLMPTYFGEKGEDIFESVGRKMARRDRPPIQRCLRRGDAIIVQIIKEGIGTKGPTLSTYVSIPGRILVMMPGMNKMGVSKKIEDEEERRRLRLILDGLKPPKGVGFIIRTAGIGKTKAEIQRDLTYLSRLWMQIEKKRDSGAGPMELYTEGDLVTRTVRDVFSTDVDHIVVDNKDVAKRVKDVIKLANPRARNKVELYEEPVPIFHKYGIEGEIEQMYSRHVPLPSGGSLVIDSTEAIVAIDVNSGKFRDHSDAEITAFKTDLEAADEIPRQLRLRDLGGVIICDFIDLRYERHRRELEQKLHDNLKKDRAKTKMLRMSQFGIIEMTRQRMRPSLKRSIYFDCPHCKGAGLVKTHESMSLDVMRRIQIAVADLKVARVELAACPEVAFYLLNRKRASLARLEGDFKKKIVVTADPTLGLDETRLSLFDSRDGQVILPSLAGPESVPHITQLGTRPADDRGRGGRHGRDDRQNRGGRGGRGGRDGGRGQGGDGRGRGFDQRRDEPRERPALEERDEIDAAEDAADEREERQAEETVEQTPATSSEAPAEPMPEEVSQSPAESSESTPSDVEPEMSEDDESVVEVEESGSELGERPAGEFDRYDRGDRRHDRQRGRRGRGGPPDRNQRGRQGGRRGGQQQRNAPQQRQEPAPQKPIAAEVSGQQADAGNEEDAEGPSPGNERYPQGGGQEGDGGRQGGQGGQGGKRRRRRGGRRHRRRRERAEAAAAAAGGGGADTASNGERPVESFDERQEAGESQRSNVSESDEHNRRTVQRIPPRPSVPPPEMPRTGSTDKHLIRSEEPVAPPPPSRPRTYRDLDAIPDDFD